MTNHPKRIVPKHRCSSPTPAQVMRARVRAKLTQEDAAAMVCAAPRSWQQWEAGDRRMLPGIWHLFLIRTGREAP